MFSFKAFRHSWRHGEEAKIVTIMPSTSGVGASATTYVDEPLPGPTVERPSEKLDPQTAAFCVFAEGGNAYIGANGGDAKRVIEQLTSRGIEWEAFRHGEHWCRSA